MPVMATTLTEFNDSANSRTYSIPGHTPLAPRLVLQKRKVPTTTGSVSETTVSVVFGTVDSAGSPIPSKVSFEISARMPMSGQVSDQTAALVVLRDIVASDEFANAVSTQNYIK